MSGGLETGRRASFVIVPEWIILADVSPAAKALYLLLVAHTNSLRGDGVVWPGMDAMARMLGYRKRQSIAPYLRELERIDAIEVRMTTWKGGRRNTYVVHETAPDGHAGPLSLKAFYAGLSATTDDGSSARTDDGSSATADKNQTKGTRRNQPDEEGTSSGGAHAMARAKAQARLTGARAREDSRGLTGAHLANLPRKTIIQKLTSVWCAVVLDNGGQLPDQDSGGWDFDGEPLARGKHPIGSQIKAWCERNDPTPELLDQMLTEIRANAEDYAAKYRRAA